MGSTFPTSTTDENHASNHTDHGLASDDETDTRDPLGHKPLHLQRNTIPDLVSLLIDSFQYASPPNVIPPEITEEEYTGKLKAWDE